MLVSLFICFFVLGSFIIVVAYVMFCLQEELRRGCGFCWTAFYATGENAKRKTGALEHPRDLMDQSLASFL